MMQRLERISFRAAALSIITFCVAVYGMNVTHSFVWDDAYNVVENQEIRDLSNVPSFFTEAWGASADSDHSRALNSNYWRPVALTSYAIDYALFGTNAWGYHLINILLHSICSVFVLLLGWRLFPLPGRERSGVLAASMIFAVHPLHTEVVNVITYRTDMLAAIFTLVALNMWIKASEASDPRRKRTLFLWVPLIYFLGVGSKEMAFTLPVLIFLYEALIRRTPIKSLVVILAPLGGVAFGYLLIRSALLSPSPMVYFGINWPTHLPVGGDGVVLTMLSVVTLYAKLLVLPWPLNPFYEWSPEVLPVQFDPLEPSVITGVMILGAWCVIATKLFKTDRRLLFLWLLMPVILVPVSHVVPIIIAAGERFLYLALLGPVMVGMIVAFRRFGTHPGTISVISIVLLIFGSMSVIRSHEWRNDEAILEAYVSQWPGSYNAWKGLRDYRVKEAQEAIKMGHRNEVERLALEVKEMTATMHSIELSAWRREAQNFRLLEQVKVADCIDQQLEREESPRRCLGPLPANMPSTD